MLAPRWLRPSRLPRLASCPASGIASEGALDFTIDAGAIGSAWHEIAALYHAQGRGAAWDSCDAIAHRHQVDAATLRDWLSLLKWQPKAGAMLRVEWPVVLRVAGVEIPGRTDLAIDDGHTVEIVDEKSGNPDFHDPGSLVQLEAYAVAAARELGRSEARASLRYAQLGEDGWVSIDVDLDEAEARLERIVRRALRQAELAPEAREYRVGDGCTFCPAAPNCPALNRDVKPFLAVQGYEPAAITLENFGAFAAAVDRASKIVEAAKDARKLFVKANGGRVESDGYAWELRQQTIAEHTRKASTFEKLQRVKLKEQA